MLKSIFAWGSWTIW